MCSPVDLNGDGAGDPLGTIVYSDYTVLSGAEGARSLLPPMLLTKDPGHDALNHRDADLTPGISVDPDVSTVCVYVSGSKTTTDSAPLYILDEYLRPAESW